MNKQATFIIITILLFAVLLFFSGQQFKEISSVTTVQIGEQKPEKIKTSEKVNPASNLILENHSDSLKTEQKKSDVNIELGQAFISDIRIGQVAANKWVIDLKDVSPDTKKDAEKMLLSMVDNVEAELDPDCKLGLVITSPIGKVTIKKQGVLIDRIYADLFGGLGMQKGDVIKSINNQEVNSLRNLYAVYKSIKNDSPSAWLSVEYERNGTLMISEYRVK